MPVVAYLSNQFPSPVEPYVVDEVTELGRRGVEVICCSARHPSRPLDSNLAQIARETLVLQRIRPRLLFPAVSFCIRRRSLLADFWRRIFLQGNESPSRRIRATLHTIAGLYFALLLQGRGVEHIHVHHGYFSSWIAMVAARVLGVGFSMTLHGSDLLVHRAYLDTKLADCKFCVTVSSYNRDRLIEQCPTAREKIFVHRLGVDVPPPNTAAAQPTHSMVLLAVGRLHKVKDHAFLIRACGLLKARGLPFLCLIAGHGPESRRLQRLIRQLKLDGAVQLLGHIPHPQLDRYYAIADIVVLTSRSEGIPLVLMEAMARGRIVLAPAITGIPELISDGATGFLYQPGSLQDFTAQIDSIYRLRSGLDPVRRAAREHVIAHFHRTKNLVRFSAFFLNQVWGVNRDAHSLLQQI